MTRLFGGVLFCMALMATPLHAQTTAALDYSVARFDADLDPWHLLSIELQHKAGWGSVIGRENIARRFGDNGQQAELELYPRLGARSYAYLSMAYSPSAIFPDWRYSAELFHKLAPAIEASAGVRYLDFDVKDVTLFTGSVGWYPRKYYLALRPFFLADDGERLLSGSMHARRYSTDEEWIGITVAGGRVPSETVTAFELERLRSALALLHGRKRISTQVRLHWEVGYEWEQLPFDRDRGRIMLGIGFDRRF